LCGHGDQTYQHGIGALNLFDRNFKSFYYTLI
jgi:hypothetical protein